MAVSSMALLKSKEYNIRHDTIVAKLTCPDKSKCATKFTNILRKRQKREQCLNLINAPSFPCIRLRRCGQFFISDSHVFINLLRPRLSDGPIVSVALLGPASETPTHFTGQTTEKRQIV